MTEYIHEHPHPGNPWPSKSWNEENRAELQRLERRRRSHTTPLNRCIGALFQDVKEGEIFRAGGTEHIAGEDIRCGDAVMFGPDGKVYKWRPNFIDNGAGVGVDLSGWARPRRPWWKFWKR